ncbi:MAG: hypothetical protein WEF28_14060, partial [Acidimicrobiia bacterium]
MTKLLTRTAAPILIIAVALTVAACGQDTGETTTTTTTETTGSEFAFGSPADAADAQRVGEIQT